MVQPAAVRGKRQRKPESKDQILAKLYYNAGSAGSFGGAEALWRTVKSLGHNEGQRGIKYLDVHKFLSKQHTYTLLKPRRVRYRKNRSLPIPGANHLFAIDIWELKRFTEIEKMKREKCTRSKRRGCSSDLDYNFVLVGIDGFSKRIGAAPMKDKSQESVVEAMEQLTKMGRFKFRVLYSDQDRSFLSHKTQEWLKKQATAHVTSSTQLHCFMAERAIQTLARKLRRLMYYTKSYDWMALLTKVVTGYNKTPHKQLVDGKYSPNEVTVFNTPEIYNYMYHGKGVRRKAGEKTKIQRAKFKSGDTVLLARPKELFRKGYEPTFNPKYYTINRVIMPTRAGQTRPIYNLKDDTGHVLEDRFYTEQLQKVSRR